MNPNNREIYEWILIFWKDIYNIDLYDKYNIIKLSFQTYNFWRSE